MPNWCENTATLCHDNPEMLARAANAVTAGTLLQELVPMPEDIGEGWYDWAITNWGTKRDVVEGNVIYAGQGFVTITFLSAWSPRSRRTRRWRGNLGSGS